MRRLLLACVASLALLPARGVAGAADEAPKPIADGVLNAVCFKQVVLLGEAPSHGEALGFDAKARITDQLVARCGFKVVLFEAPIYDFLGFAMAVKTHTAKPDDLDNAIGRFWWTRELAPWRGRLFEASTQGRLALGGIDDQVSITSHYAQAALPQLISAASSKTTATECRETVSRQLAYTYDAAHPFDDAEKLRLQQCARKAADAAAVNPSLDSTDRVMLENFARYVDRQSPGVTMDRDESMYRNLVWYLDRLPAKTKVVVWTATVHAARQRGSLPAMPLGARIAQRLGDRVGAVGFTAYGGQTSRAARPASAIPDAPPESLEATVTKGSTWAILDSKKLRAIGSISSRLLGKFVADTWSDYFDAVVVVRREVAPTFDPWK